MRAHIVGYLLVPDSRRPGFAHIRVAHVHRGVLPLRIVGRIAAAPLRFHDLSLNPVRLYMRNQNQIARQPVIDVWKQTEPANFNGQWPGRLPRHPAWLCVKRVQR
jgi:hypothetical protein